MTLVGGAVVFDLDGVLVDSNAIAERHMHAWAARASARAAGAQVIAVASTLPPAALGEADVVGARLDDLSVTIAAATIEVGWSVSIREGGARYTELS